ncbi:hypothetical protein M8J75_012289 [Diaphorina citri]|nr:hypothetical protein M8J75_012289 [Diaphorina citri]KAI5752321.1 hypothetical protein M8J77_015912 [Diaphorina citri]
MNSTKSEISEKEMTDSGRIDSGFISNSNLDSDHISTSSLLSDDNLNPMIDLPHESESDKPTLAQQHSHFDSGVDVDISEQFSELNLKSSSADIPTVLSSDHRVQEINEEDKYWMICYTQDDEGDTPLHIAILGGTEHMVHHLVQVAPSSVCLDIRNDLYQTPLHLSVLTSQSRLTRHLVLCNANYRKCDKYARTPLHWAVVEGSLECVRALTNPISSAELAQVMGIKFEKRTSLKNETINSTDYEGMTCIHHAAIGGNVDIMRQLVLNGGDINAREWKSGMSALHIAVEKRDIDMVQFLLQSDSMNVDIETFAGFTPYQICYDEKIERLLLDAGAENLPHAEDDNDMCLDSEDEDEEEEMTDSHYADTKLQENTSHYSLCKA